MAFKRTEALAAIADGLGSIKSSCEARGLIKLFDNHRVAQYFFCRLLNAAYGLDLVELDGLKANFPAIDLGDKQKRIAYQVTSQKVSDKVSKTLETFCCHNLDEQFDTLKVLVIGDRQRTYDAVIIPERFKFDVDKDIIDIADVLKHIDDLDTPRLELIQTILAEELSSPLKLSTAIRGLEGLSIDIGVSSDPPAHSDPSDKFSDDRVLRYSATKTNGEEEETVIAPQMGYLSKMGKVPLEAISFFWNPFKCQYPNLDVTFVNNTGGTLVVTKAVFEVVESVPDVAPVIVLKDNNAQMKLVIDNEGWGKVCNPVIRCNILPTGQTEPRADPPIGHIPVAEPFAHEFRLSDFEEAGTVELERAFASLGVDVEAIRKVRVRGASPMVAYAIQNGLDVATYEHLGRFPQLDTNEAWAPFPDGYAVVTGKLDYSDEAGVSYSVPFKVRVFLFGIKFNLPMPPSHTYNVMLEPEGKKYEAICEAVHSLKSGEADRIHIRVGCIRSATHKFRIRWYLSGGRELVSGPLSLRHFVPKRWENQRQQRAEVGKEEEVQLPPPGPQMGCVEASVRGAMGLAAAVAQARQAVPETVGYFAYGSNMHLPRLRRWAKSAQPVSAFKFHGFVMKWNKLGDDGSAKCNMVKTENNDDVVHGVVFEMLVEDFENLIRHEDGYDPIQFGFNTPRGQVRLVTFIARQDCTAEGLQPHTWYKSYVQQGAESANLPEEYIEKAIRSIAAKEAPEPSDPG